VSKIKSAIELCLDGVSCDGRTVTARFIFPEHFIGFQGHFPVHKILPGVCQIQSVLSAYEKGAEKRVVLQEIVYAKYFAPVFPGEEVLCTIRDMEEKATGVTVKGFLTKGDTKVTEMKLRLATVAYDGLRRI
jgi:3-hydroxymyristoyl/3-hydroxydecanoyl-(acyl carrier protein) dehydratase